ncbi:hypothetical protein ACFQY5_03815 [Paeniroseomonas aquatica]|uniref:hypothetical protein n=1 Tax=Paeniroseomonas aquatica TaxID=373043 RepID=UPI00361E96C3
MPSGLDSQTIQVSARAVLNTTFATVLGFNTMAVAGAVQARRADAGMDGAGTRRHRLHGHQCGTPSDRTATNCGVTTVPRVPDTTLASLNNNMDLLRLAAADLVNILYGTRETVANLWVAVVPFASTVNLGPNRQSWLAADSAANLTGDFAPTTWRGCVEARAGYAGAPADGDGNDDTPREAPFRPFRYLSTLGQYTLAGAAVAGDNDWARKLWTPTTTGGNAITENWYFWRGNYQVGPNVGCPATAVLPLTAAKTTVLNAIQSLRPSFRGGTMGNLGLQAGWFALSPRWRDSWALGPAPRARPPACRSITGYATCARSS